MLYRLLEAKFACTQHIGMFFEVVEDVTEVGASIKSQRHAKARRRTDVKLADTLTRHDAVSIHGWKMKGNK